MQKTITAKRHKISGYEQVLEIHDEAHDLHACLVIHNTRLGPAIGGIRAHYYTSFDQALEEALLLSKEMTYKTALAKVGAGGGKAIIITNKEGKKTESQLRAFGEFVKTLQGQFICTRGIGITSDDLEAIAAKTRFVAGLPHPRGSGDLTPFTARGDYKGIQALCCALFKHPSVKGKKIALQGLGGVGMRVARHLFWAGAKLTVADIDANLTKLCFESFGAEVVSPEEILQVPCDIFAPCAKSFILNHKTIDKLQCKAVAGLANLPFEKDSDAEALHKRKILYAPSFVINSGGLMNIFAELNGKTYSPIDGREHVDQIYSFLLEIFAKAEREKKSPHIVATEMAEYNLAHNIGKREKSPIFH